MDLLGCGFNYYPKSSHGSDRLASDTVKVAMHTIAARIEIKIFHITQNTYVERTRPVAAVVANIAKLIVPTEACSGQKK